MLVTVLNNITRCTEIPTNQVVTKFREATLI